MTRPRRAGREAPAEGSVHRSASAPAQNTNTPGMPLPTAGSKKPCAASGPDKMGGLPLPDVVRELLREQAVLR